MVSVRILLKLQSKYVEMNVFSEKVKNVCIIYLRKLICLNIITTAMFYVALWVFWNELNCIGW